MYDVIMHRTQLLLETWQYEALKTAAEQQGRSISAVVREILSRHLSARRRGAKRGLADLEGIVEDRAASGREHDRFLYGQDPEPT